MIIAGFCVTLSANVSAQKLTTPQNATANQIITAKNNWVYAAMSNNVYGDHIQISMPTEWFRVNSKSGNHGFYAETYIKKGKKGKISEIVISYRGTQFWSPEDWAEGNIVNLQQGDAEEYAGEVIAKYNKLGVPIKFTGHSLGGALAQNVANNLQREAVVFDTSPLNGFDYGTSAKSIVNIHEHAEVLVLMRNSQPGDVVYNFVDELKGSIANHDMYPLAQGMKDLAVTSLQFGSNNTQTNRTSQTSSPASSSLPTKLASYDGTYYCDVWRRYGFHIAGNTGVAVKSENPNYNVGDEILRFSPTGSKTFSGEQLCADGKFHPVTGALLDDGSLHIVISGCTSCNKMVRDDRGVLNRPIPTKSNIEKLITDFYNEKGEFSGILRLDNVEKIWIKDSHDSKINALEVAVKYSYTPIPGNLQRKTDSGQDERLFFLANNGGDWVVTRMNGRMSGKISCTRSYSQLNC